MLPPVVFADYFIAYHKTLSLIHIFINNFYTKTVSAVVLTAFVVFCIAIFIQTANEEIKETGTLKIGQYIYLGSYKNEPLKWVVLNKDENGYLLWCDNTVEYMEFDYLDETNSDNIYGSNIWIESDAVSYTHLDVYKRQDYYRVIQPLGFKPEISNRYFYAYNFYTVNDMSSEDIKGSLSNIISPKVENDNEYFSTQFIFIKVSMIINYLLKIVLGKSPEIFNIKVLGILYAAIYSYGLCLFLTNINFKYKYINFLFLIIALVILCDMGYLLYFNSFFGEAAIIASLMITLGLLTAIIKTESKIKSLFYVILFYIFALALTEMCIRDRSGHKTRKHSIVYRTANGTSCTLYETRLTICSSSS